MERKAGWEVGKPKRKCWKGVRKTVPNLILKMEWNGMEWNRMGIEKG